MASVDENGEVTGDGPIMSKQEIREGVQAALALCATCAHLRADHPQDGSCAATWRADGALRSCACAEYWPTIDQREDGLQVVDHEIAFGGSLSLALNRRLTSDLWAGLRPAGKVTLTLQIQVGAKGFKLAKEKGDIIGLIETRKLTVDGIVLSDDEGV